MIVKKIKEVTMSVLEKEVETTSGGTAVREIELDANNVQAGMGFYNACRRFRDIVCSMVALLVLWPFMAITAVAIVIDSPGASPIFVQERIGKNGKPFKFYKFSFSQCIGSLGNECL